MNSIRKYIQSRPIEILIFLILLATIGFVYYSKVEDGQSKDRDATRISAIPQIRYALTQYYTEFGVYPPCLYTTANCKSLEGSDAMPTVPRDPLTDMGYSYSAFGSGAQCNHYHLGTSLERTGSQALLLGADAAPKLDSELCQGSAHDFSGLSYAPGGQPCNDIAGTAQPTDSSDGETCFDIAH